VKILLEVGPIRESPHSTMLEFTTSWEQKAPASALKLCLTAKAGKQQLKQANNNLYCNTSGGLK